MVSTLAPRPAVAPRPPAAVELARLHVEGGLTAGSAYRNVVPMLTSGSIEVAMAQRNAPNPRVPLVVCAVIPFHRRAGGKR